MKLFKDIVFYQPMVMVDMISKEKFLSNLLNDKSGPIIPICFITDRNHELMIMANRYKPIPDSRVDGVAICIAYVKQFKA
jgi:hypothetical protein